jgi:hypothetical protein
MLFIVHQKYFKKILQQIQSLLLQTSFIFPKYTTLMWTNEDTSLLWLEEAVVDCLLFTPENGFNSWERFDVRGFSGICEVNLRQHGSAS